MSKLGDAVRAAGLQVSRSHDFYADATAASKCGWSTIPIRNDPSTGKKRAACHWGAYQKTAPTAAELWDLFAQPGLTGWAAILGPVSRGLWARDFDLVDAYERWAADFPKLAGTLATYRTGRGFQVLGYHTDPVSTRDLGDGEIRGAGAYSVMPRSLHPSGCRYWWIIGGPDAVIRADPVAAGLTRSWGDCPSVPSDPDTSDSTEEAEVSEVSEGSEESDVVRGSTTEGADACGGEVSLDDLIQQALPIGDNQNHKRLFFLARGIRAIERAEGGPWSEQDVFERAFLPWYRGNQFLREGQSQEAYFLELLEALDDVQQPLGDGVLDQAFTRAANSPPPAEAARFRDPRTRLLVAWCKELQRVAGAGPFFLSTRTVSDKLSLHSPSRASAFLHRLEREGLLVVTERGSPHSNKATRFRYVASVE